MDAFGDLIWDEPNRALVWNGERHRVTPSQAIVLPRLIRAQGCIVHREALMGLLWGDRSDGYQPKSLDVVTHRLRRRLAAIGVTTGIGISWGFGLYLTQHPRNSGIKPKRK